MERFLATLAANAIEATALALGVACLCRLAVRKRPILGAPLRHLLWLVVLAKLIAPPVFRVPWPLGPVDRPLDQGAPEELAALPADGGAGDAFGSWPDPSEGSDDTADGAGDGDGGGLWGAADADPDVDPSSDSIASFEPLASFGSRFEILSRWGVWVWALGSLFFAAAHIGGIAAFARRLRRAEPAPERLVSLCAQVARRMELGRPPKLRVLSEAISPLVWAFGRSVVVLPRSVVQAMDAESLRPLLAHELAHLRRGDHLAAWFDLAVGCLAWWVPTYWWARREAERAGDEACDARAVAAVGDRKEYAETLLSTLEVLSAQETTPLPAVGRGLGEREAVARRLTMIVRGPLSHRVSAGGWLGVALLAAIVLPISTLGLANQESVPDAPGPQAEPAPEPVAPGALPQPVVPQEVQAVPPRPGASSDLAQPGQPAQPAQPRQPARAAPPAPVAPLPPAPAGGPAPVRARAGRAAYRTYGVWDAETGEPSGDPLEKRLIDMEDRLEAMLAELRAIRRERAGRPRTVAPAGEAVAVNPPAPTAGVRATRLARPPAAGAVAGPTGTGVYGSDAAPESAAGARAEGTRRPPEETLRQIEKEMARMKQDFEERMAALRRDQDRALRQLRDLEGGEDAPRTTPAR